MIRPVPKPTPRKAPLEPGQHRRKYMSQGRKDRTNADLARRDWCRGQPCMASREGCLRIVSTNHGDSVVLAHAWAWGFGPCSGRVVPHHAGKKTAYGKKTPEGTTVPLCSGHHLDITGKWGGYGVFQALGEDGRRALQNLWIEDATARYNAHGGRRST